MATSRPILVGDWLTDIRTGSPFIGSNIHATIHEVRRPQGYILQGDFGLDSQGGDAYWQLMRERVFGMTGDGDIHIATTNGTAPGLYVREGDDTSDWETYRRVLARRVEEAMAARGDGVGGVGVGETATAAETTTRQDDEIRVGCRRGGVNTYRQLAADDRRLSNVPPPSSPQPPPPSRFSLLEVDADPSTDAASPSPPQVLKAPVDLAALQQELRAEREAKRALAATQTPPGRFDLLECDLPAVPATTTVKAPQQRPVVSSTPLPRNPVETITDLTAARSPLELARMLEGLNDELSTMMRQREAN